jgi:hypothetical protein
LQDEIQLTVCATNARDPRIAGQLLPGSIWNNI